MLFNNFFPNGTELRSVNQTFKSALQESTNLFSPVKHYGERIAHIYETTHSDIIMMRKEFKQQNEFLNACKKQKTGKKIALERKFVFTTEEILHVVKETKATITAKQSRKQPRKHSIQKFLENEKDGMLETESDNSCSDCIVVASSISI